MLKEQRGVTMLDHKEERAVQVWRSFWNMNKSIMQCIEESASKVNLSVPQYIVIIAFLHHGEISQKTIGEETKLPKSTLSQAIDKLVERGVLERKPSKTDRREIGLSLKDEGQQLIKEIREQEQGLHHRFTNIIEILSDAEVEQLIHIHEKMIGYLQTRGGKSQC